MRPKASILFSLLTVAVLLFSTNALATVEIEADTDKTYYTAGDPVYINASWQVVRNDTFFSQYATTVFMNVTLSGSTYVESYWGYWELLGGRGGAVYVDAYVTRGNASYVWDSTDISTYGPWYVHVEVFTWDNFSTQTVYDWGETDTDYFWVSP